MFQRANAQLTLNAFIVHRPTLIDRSCWCAMWRQCTVFRLIGYTAYRPAQKCDRIRCIAVVCTALSVAKVWAQIKATVFMIVVMVPRNKEMTRHRLYHFNLLRIIRNADAADIAAVGHLLNHTISIANPNIQDIQEWSTAQSQLWKSISHI